MSLRRFVQSIALPKQATALALAGALMLCAAMPAFGQEDKGDPPGGSLEVFNPLSSKSLLLSLVILVAGAGFFAGQLYLLRKTENVTADDIVKNCTITIVIIAATVLIVAGYNSQQTAQAFGLFGTIVGYMLGRAANKPDAKEAGGKSDQKDGKT